MTNMDKMNLKQALNKLREDIQYWVTLNIRNILSKLDGKANISDLASVATSGSYNDLTNKPTILTLGTSASNAAAGNHTHTNVQPVSMTGDILAWALDSAPMGLTPIYTGSATTNTPSSAYTYSNGYVLKRTSNETTVVLFSYTDTAMAVNHYVNSAWKGWSIAATQDYVRDAISDIGSSTASGCVSEFDSGVISYAAGQTYTNTKDAKSKFYLVTAKHSSYGSHSWVIDFNYLTTSYQAFRVMVGGSQNSTYFNPVWICVQVKKDSSNRLVVGVPEDYSDVTLTQVCGFY